MAAPIDLRNDFDSVSLRRLAKRTRDATQSRRLLALAEVYDGGSRTDASRIGGVGLQIIRDWVLRFNARGPDGLVDGKSPGAPSKLNADHRRALAEVVEAGPVPAVDGVVRWRRKDLARWLLETFAISLDETTVGRELKALGFAKISARPRHYAQNELAVEAFKKNFPAELAKIRARLPKGVEIELWWQDEARIGQKNKLTRRWARRGTRPRAPRDQRTEWAYIFGAICPAKGKGAGLVMPWCDTDAMAAHLIEISAAVDPGAHAVLIVDQAGWHLTPKLAIPDNITVLALPPRSPELNPVENVWQFMRDNWLSNRIFKSYEDIVAPGGGKRRVAIREVINGVMYILSTGCQWRALPKDLPPRSTVHDYLGLWNWDGTLDRIHHALYLKCREKAAREASPTACIIDSQSVKSAEKGGLASTATASMPAS